MTRAGLVNYSGRHTFKGFLDDLRVSARGRDLFCGHSTKKNVSIRYGPRFVSEQQAEIVQRLSNRQIWRLSLIMMRAKRRAERGELKVVEAWRIDRRSGDKKLQAVLAKQAEQYS